MYLMTTITFNDGISKQPCLLALSRHEMMILTFSRNHNNFYTNYTYAEKKNAKKVTMSHSILIFCKLLL